MRRFRANQPSPAPVLTTLERIPLERKPPNG